GASRLAAAARGAPSDRRATGVDAVGNGIPLAVAAAHDVAAVDASVQKRGGQELESGLVLREVDVLSVPRAPPPVECGEDRDEAKGHSDDVDVGTIKEHGRDARFAGDVGEARQRGATRA